MGFFKEAAGLQQAAFAPEHDYWYTPRGQMSGSGVAVTQDLALKISTAWRCTQILSGLIASVDLNIYHRHTDTSGREIRHLHRELPVSHLLGRRPNADQNAHVWREQGQARLTLRGNMFNRIERQGSQITALWPIAPESVQIKRAPTGRPVYGVRSGVTGTTEWLSRDEVWHVPSLALAPDGLSGLGVLEAARESMGLAIAAEQFGARVFSQGDHPGLVISHPSTMSAPAQERLRASIHQQYGTSGGWWSTAFLEEGMTLSRVPYGLSPEDAQLLGMKELQARDVATFYGVPPHMVGLVTRNTSWGTGIEQMTLGFYAFTMFRLFAIWEHSIDDELLPGDEFFARFDLTQLLRADTATRWNAYRIAQEYGDMSPNEVRQAEGQNPVDGLDGHYIQVNRMRIAGGEQSATMVPVPLPGQSAEEVAGLYAKRIAGWVVQKEQHAMERAAKRHADDREGWAKAVGDFYTALPEHIAETMQIGQAAAERYCREQCEDLLANGVQTMMDWEQTRGDELVRLALAGNDFGTARNAK